MTETKKPLPERIAEWQALEAEIAQREASGQSPCAWIFDSEEMARAILPDLIAAYNAMLAADTSASARAEKLEAENAHLRSRLKNSTMPLTNEQQLIDALERVKEAEALLKSAAFHMAGGGILSRAGAAEIDAWLKQAETTE